MPFSSGILRLYRGTARVGGFVDPGVLRVLSFFFLGVGVFYGFSML